MRGDEDSEDSDEDKNIVQVKAFKIAEQDITDNEDEFEINQKPRSEL